MYVKIEPKTIPMKVPYFYTHSFETMQNRQLKNWWHNCRHA